MGILTFVYPGQYEDLKEEMEQVKDTICANETLWCNFTSHYPDKIISKLIDQSVLSHIFFNTNVNEKVTTFTFFRPSEEKICRTSEDMVYPRLAKDRRGIFRFIVNRPKGHEGFKQVVQITKCETAESTCGDGKIAGLESSSCKQEFLDHKLLALNDNGTDLIVDSFSFPSGCSCYLSESQEL